MAHDHRMNPVGEPFLTAKTRLSEDARSGMMARHNDAGRYGPSGSVGPKGREHYMRDLKQATTDIGLDPENHEHLGAVHRVYAAHLPAQDRHHLTGDLGLPATTQKGAFDFLDPPKYGQR